LAPSSTVPAQGSGLTNRGQGRHRKAHRRECQALLGLKTSPTSCLATARSAGTPKGEAPAPAACKRDASPPSLAAPPPPDAPEQVAAANTAQPAATHLGSGLRIAGIACGAIGVVSVGNCHLLLRPGPSPIRTRYRVQTVPQLLDLSGRPARRDHAVGVLQRRCRSHRHRTLLYVLGWQATDAAAPSPGLRRCWTRAWLESPLQGVSLMRNHVSIVALFAGRS